jgi:hypothetical protein
MPWQQHVIDVATEIDPETGGLWYREVDFGVPRQSGKTTLLLPKFVWRAEAAHLLGGRQKMLYAAQTGKDAVDKFDEDYIEDLAAARVMRGRYRVTNNQGRKRIRFRSGSYLAPVATTPKAGHGKTLDDGTLDEAWAQTDNRVEAAWRPAMITRGQAQLWITSTAGTAASVYWRAKVLRGRAVAEAKDPSSRVAYFEWSMEPGMDPYNPDNWWRCMPALGFTITEDAIRHELETIEGGLPEWMRAYANLWPDDVEDEQWLLPKASWLGPCLDQSSLRAGPPALALSVHPSRLTASIAYAAVRSDGLPMVQVVQYGQGTSWAVAALGELVRDKGATCVVINGAGPVSNLADEIRAEIGARCPLEVLTAGEEADACGSIFDAVVTEQLRHTGQAELDIAVRGLVERTLAGGRKAWDMIKAQVDTSPACAVTEALWGLAKHPGRGRFLF